MPDSMIERVARALCSHDGLPEDTKFEGRPMWMSFADEARAAVAAMREPTGAMKARGAANFDMPTSEAVAGAGIVFTDMIDAALEDGQ